MSPDNPDYASILLIDQPIPPDIAGHPEEGWKDIPDWEREREKGNIRKTPYQTSQALVYTHELNYNYIWFILVLWLLIMPTFFPKKNIQDLLSGKYYTGFFQIGKIIKKTREEEKKKNKPVD